MKGEKFGLVVWIWNWIYLKYICLVLEKFCVRGFLKIIYNFMLYLFLEFWKGIIFVLIVLMRRGVCVLFYDCWFSGDFMG